MYTLFPYLLGIDVNVFLAKDPPQWKTELFEIEQIIYI